MIEVIYDSVDDSFTIKDFHCQCSLTFSAEEANKLLLDLREAICTYENLKTEYELVEEGVCELSVSDLMNF